MTIESLLERKEKALYCIHPDESILNCIKIDCGDKLLRNCLSNQAEPPIWLMSI